MEEHYSCLLDQRTRYTFLNLQHSLNFTLFLCLLSFQSWFSLFRLFICVCILSPGTLSLSNFTFMNFSKINSLILLTIVQVPLFNFSFSYFTIFFLCVPLLCITSISLIHFNYSFQLCLLSSMHFRTLTIFIFLYFIHSHYLFNVFIKFSFISVLPSHSFISSSLLSICLSSINYVLYSHARGGMVLWLEWSLVNK